MKLLFLALAELITRVFSWSRPDMLAGDNNTAFHNLISNHKQLKIFYFFNLFPLNSLPECRCSSLAAAVNKGREV